MKKWLIDTDVLIDYFRGLPQAATFLEKIIQRDTCCLSVISIVELYASIREGKERNLLELFLQSFNIIPVDQSIAQSGSLYKRDYGKSHGVGLADAIIAATSNFQDAKLVTLNAKHLPMLDNLHVPYSKP